MNSKEPFRAQVREETAATRAMGWQARPGGQQPGAQGCHRPPGRTGTWPVARGPWHMAWLWHCLRGVCCSSKTSCRSSLVLPGLTGAAPQLGGSAGARGRPQCNPFLLRTGTFPSLSHRSLWMAIFSCRYFPQANFSVTFHPFLSVSGCYFLPSRCLPSLISRSPPALPDPEDGSGARAGVGLGLGSRQGLAVLGSSGGVLGTSPNTPEGTRCWRRAGGAGNPLAAPESGFGVCSGSSVARGDREESGGLKAPRLCWGPFAHPN